MIFYLSLAVISAGLLAYEVLLVRLFAIVQWHHFAFMAISIALLGFGISGALLSLFQKWLLPRFAATFVVCAATFAISAVASFLLAQHLPFNALEVIWDPSELLYLTLMYGLLAIPFTSGATCIGLGFLRYRDQIGYVYFWNLLGSGAGALGVMITLSLFSPIDNLLLTAALGLAAAALPAMGESTQRLRLGTAGLVTLAAIAWILIPDAWLALRISEYKGLSAALRVKDAKLIREYSGPLGLVSALESPAVPFRHLPGLSLQAPSLPPRQIGVFIDGGSLAAINAYDGRRESLSYLNYTTDALAYALVNRPAVLVLGAGGGRSVLQGIYHQASHIDAVELNPDIIRLMAKDYAAFAGRIFSRADVSLHTAEARSFVATTLRQWDLIQIPLLDAPGAAAGGVHGLSESYIYTVEAFELYFRRLRPGGWLSITRWLKIPPRDTLKLVLTAVEALERQGVESPGARLAIIRGINTVTLLIKQGDITGSDIAAIKGFARDRSFDVAYYPLMAREEANQFNILSAPYLFAGTMALIGAERATFIERYKFDIAPATDNRPYFFDFFKWRTLPELFTLRKLGGAALLEWGELILFATLIQATLLSLLLILGPLWLGSWSAVGGDSTWRICAYFFALGLAFLFIEIAFIQKFILFLGHPLYAVAVVLTGFLVFAGLGSGSSAHLARWFQARRTQSRFFRLISEIDFAVTGICGIALIYLLSLPTVFELLIHIDEIGRVTLSILLIAPLAFFMGLPFPLGLTRVSETNREFVPWAWGLNGCASVVSAILATILAMHFGFSVVVLLAVGLYILAASVFRLPLPSGGT